MGKKKKGRGERKREKERKREEGGRKKKEGRRKGVSHCHLNLAETQRQAEELESFIVEKGMTSDIEVNIQRLLAWGSCWRAN